MASVLGFIAYSPGVIHPKSPFQIQKYNSTKFKRQYMNPLLSKKLHHTTRLKYPLGEGLGNKYALSVGRNHHQLSLDNGFSDESSWPTPIKEAFSALKSLFRFLVEQPSQLKYIEWPSFQTTLKTATLTLVLVALLIVALSSVDSALSYLLAIFLRKTP